MNKVILIGRLAKDPESRVTDKGLTICMYTLAVQRKTKNREADFFNCVAFGKGAEFVEKWFHKGDMMALVGHLQTSTYESEGRTIYRVEVIGEEHKMCGSPRRNEERFIAVPDDGYDDDMPF